MFMNSSIIHDEILAHRLGLVPIMANPHMFESMGEEGGEQDEVRNDNELCRMSAGTRAFPNARYRSSCCPCSKTPRRRKDALSRTPCFVLRLTLQYIFGTTRGLLHATVTVSGVLLDNVAECDYSLLFLTTLSCQAIMHARFSHPAFKDNHTKGGEPS